MCAHRYGHAAMSSKKAKTKNPAPAKKAAAKSAVKADPKAAAKADSKPGAPAPESKPAAKPAAKPARTKGRGVRYDASKKQEVIDFAIAHNMKKGRGGQSAAARKFGISILTVSSWLKGSGSKPAKAPKAGKAAPAPKVSAALTGKIKALLDLGDRIRKAEAELRKLQDQYASLSASIRSAI